MENKENTTVNETEQQSTSRSAFQKELLKKVNDLRDNGPNVNTNSVVMVILQAIFWAGVLGGLAGIGYVTFATNMDGADANMPRIIIAACIPTIIFSGICIWLAKLVRRRNGFIINMSHRIVRDQD